MRWIKRSVWALLALMVLGNGGGMAVTYSVEGALRYPVRIRYQRERRDDADEIMQLQVPVTAGHGAIGARGLPEDQRAQRQQQGQGGTRHETPTLAAHH